jgi:hypothetical protein
VPLPETPEEQAKREQALIEYTHVKSELEAQLQAAKDAAAELQQRTSQQESGAASPAQAEQSANENLEALRQQLAAAQAKARELETRLADHVRGNLPMHPFIVGAMEAAPPTNARITIRGSAYQLGDEVPRGFIRVATVGEPPAVPAEKSGRLELADWLADPQHPLVARVAVNRLWHHVFGAGLVRTCDYFGSRGDVPSHPELLDFLAVRFVQQGWSVKDLVRQLVLSRAYRMSSEHDDASYARDPENRWLWRMNRRRLEAEAIRDAVLSASGELDASRGGPSLPELTWLPGAVNGYVLVKGEGDPSPAVARRRSVYLPAYRRPVRWTEGMRLFNMPLPTAVTGARPVTTVPTQALYLMNSDFLIDQGRKAAERLLARGDLSDANRLRELYLAALCRPPRAGEVERSLAFVDGVSSESSRLEAWSLLCHAVFATSEFCMRF